MIRRPPRSPLFPYTPLSRSPLAITAARVLQGLGIAMILPGAYAVVPTLIPPRFRGTALGAFGVFQNLALAVGDRKSTRLNSSHSQISYAVFCLKKKQKHDRQAGDADLCQVDVAGDERFTVLVEDLGLELDRDVGTNLDLGLALGG